MQRIIYFSILSSIIIYAAAIHFTSAIEGILPAGGTEQFYFEYAAVAVTLLLVFLAVRLIRKNLILRMMMLEGAALLDITGWGIFPDVPSFFYLAILCLIAFVFVFPKHQQQ